MRNCKEHGHTHVDLLLKLLASVLCCLHKLLQGNILSPGVMIHSQHHQKRNLYGKS